MAGIPGKYPPMKRLSGWIAAAIVLLSALFKLGLIGEGVFPFNADEAIVALMARHTLQGEWPVFFYGQAYMGSLDATLAAIGFRLLGEQVLVIRLLQVAIYCGTIVTTILLGWRLFPNRIAGLIAGLVLAVPTTNLTVYTTVSLGGYGEALLIGNLILLTGLRAYREQFPLPISFLLGFLLGLGFWVFGLTLVFSVAVILMLLRGVWALRPTQRVRTISSIALGTVLGLSPVIYWVSVHGFNALFAELGGAAVAGVSGVGYFSQILQSLRNLILFGTSVIFGFRPPWDVYPLFIPGLLLALAFWLAAGANLIWKRELPGSAQDGIRLLRDVAVLTLLGYVLTPFGADPSGRYFLPINIILTILAGAYVVYGTQPRSIYLRWLLLTGLMIFNLGSNLQVARSSTEGFTTQFDASTRIDHGYDMELIHFLEASGATRGYSTYWISYPLAFESGEKTIFVPALPYHADLRYTERDNRYQPYAAAVAEAGQIAFITHSEAALDRVLIEFMASEGIQWRERAIGPYHVFYGLDNKPDIDRLKREWNR
jgi:hypothetical protein